MPLSIRQYAADRTFCESFTLDALSRVIPAAAVDQALAQYAPPAVRVRKFTLPMVVWIVIALNLFTASAIPHVIRTVTQGLRLFWPDPAYRLPSAAALVYRRAQIGVRPFVALFQHVCQPLATPATPGAFLFGLRLMALDGTVEDVADTPANARAFGRLPATPGPAAFPQLRAVYLIECGTHAIVDAGFWPCRTSERVGGTRLLRSITAGMLLLWDRGFHAAAMIRQVRQHGAQMLGRLPAHVKLHRLGRCADGSYLATLPACAGREGRYHRMLVRIVEYQLTDPALASGERYRLITTLTNAQLAPALDLACAYHERWEIELVIDEVDTHQRLVGRPFRSRTPLGVMQEAYALLLAHYVVRVLLHEAAMTVGLDPDRLSFIHVLRVLREAIVDFQIIAPRDHDALYARLLRDIAQGRLPARCPRCNPRVVKRTTSSFRRKRPEHWHIAQPTVRTFRAAVAIKRD